ncbi:MAG: protein phosphatase CheZ [Rhodospirillales bacterium]|nr:protein phosphatase CheZ [Rhodospirillales bacterium]
MEELASLRANIREDISSEIKGALKDIDFSAGDDEQSTVVERVMAEVINLNDHISATKEEITALKAADETNSSITSATDELTEVVKTTEAAANAILENAELIDGVVAGLRKKIPEGDPDDIEADVDKLEFISMELLTACSFQDITGQRINKVVNALNYIEERLSKMISIWNIKQGTADTHAMTFAEGDEREDKDMIHGPQGDVGGMDQDDIDSMFD